MHFYKLNDNIMASTSLLPYEELIPNTSDGAGEKHVPVISANGNTITVTVGSVAHPMLDAHYIMWITIETTKDGQAGYQQKWLRPGMEPKITFELTDGEEVVAAYEYCNLHGLWVNHVK